MLEGLKTNSKNLERSEKSILLKGRVLEVNRMLAATVNIDDWLGEKGNTIEVPFRSPVIPRHPSAGKAPEYTFVTRPHFHNRSVALGKVERARFPFLNIKASGYVKHLEEMIASWSEEKRARFDRATNVGWHVTETDNIGLMSEEAARSEMQNSETLHRLGVAGSRVAAVIALDELPYEREDGTYELRTATQSGLQPAEAIRVMSCEFRVRDMFAYAQDPAVSKEEMFQMFTRDVKSFEKPIDYVIWFAMTLGRNIALVHNARLTHNFVTDHNILPDATFADSGDLTSFDGALIPQHVDIEDIDNWKLTVDELADMLDLPEADKLFNEGQKFFLRLAMDYRGGIETVGDICDMCREKQLLSEDEITGMLVVFSSSYERQIRLSCEGGDTWRAYWVELAKSKVPPKLRDALFPIQLNAK